MNSPANIQLVPEELHAAPPAGARVWNLEGHYVYAAFVDAHVTVEAPRPLPGSPGEHWNPMVTPGRSALDGAGLSREQAKELRELGFAEVNRSVSSFAKDNDGDAVEFTSSTMELTRGVWAKLD